MTGPVTRDARSALHSLGRLPKPPTPDDLARLAGYDVLSLLVPPVRGDVRPLERAVERAGNDRFERLGEFFVVRVLQSFDRTIRMGVEQMKPSVLFVDVRQNETPFMGTDDRRASPRIEPTVPLVDGERLGHQGVCDQSLGASILAGPDRLTSVEIFVVGSPAGLLDDRRRDGRRHASAPDDADSLSIVGLLPNPDLG
jgi:hypothetical protein